MYLSQLKLWNFRKFGNDSFDLSQAHLEVAFTKGLNVLIGENDSGKSSIVDAIKLALRTHSVEWIAPSDDDFYDDSTRFRIELRFDDFSADGEEAKYFTEWLGWEGEGDTAKVFLRIIYDVTKTADRIIPSELRAGTDETGYPLTTEAREQLRVTYLKPLRDAANELSPRKGSRLSKILHGHEAFKGKEDGHHLLTKFNEFTSTVRSYFIETEELDDKAGKQLKDSIDEFIRAFCDDTHETELDVFEGNLRDILEKLKLSIKDGRNPGLGTLNRLFMAGELLHLKKANWNGLRLGLIEELESHLHPQAQLKVIENLQCQERMQLILTTHSPNLASKVKLENLIICSNSDAYPMGESHTLLKPPDYKFLEKFLDVTKSNLFFARGVILVEGWAEELLLPSLARKIGFDFTKKGVSVVNVGSIALRNYANVFVRKEQPELDVPISIVTDVDIPFYEREDDKVAKLDEKLVRGLSVTAAGKKKADLETQKVRSFITPEWTLEFSLYRSTALSPYFVEVVKEVHSGTDWDTDFELSLATKLLKKTLNKSEIAYRLAQKLESVDALDIQATDSANYLVEAIRYASRN